MTYRSVALSSYDSPTCLPEEFIEDLSRVKYVRRLIRKYILDNDLQERLILNHIIVLSNVFGVETTVRLLFFRHRYSEYSILKTFLKYLDYMPPMVMDIDGKNIISDLIPEHDIIKARLKETIG